MEKSHLFMTSSFQPKTVPLPHSHKSQPNAQRPESLTNLLRAIHVPTSPTVFSNYRIKESHVWLGPWCLSASPSRFLSLLPPPAPLPRHVPSPPPLPQLPSPPVPPHSPESLLSLRPTPPTKHTHFSRTH